MFASIALLSGCTPSPAVLPDSVLEHEGTAELENNEYVIALRANQLAEDMAWNSGDFTIAPLTESTTPDGIHLLYRHYFSYTFRDYEPVVYVGPRIWTPLSVETTSEGVEVKLCDAAQDRTITMSDPETSYDLEDGRIVTWTLDVEDDGRVSLDHVSGTQEVCDASGAEIVTFDPAPIPPEKITEGDIRKPAGE
jgi:hypothetical protein